jgi:hypothetical protein
MPRSSATSWSAPGRDAYKDFLPPGFLWSLAQNPHHDARSWQHRVSEPGSTTWIISDDGNA